MTDLIAHCPVSGSNTSPPTVPTEFGVEIIAGTILCRWNEPTIVPRRTFYQIVSAPFSLSDVASKVIVYEGDALSAVLQYSINTPLWLQLRAGAGSYYSAWSPETYGLGVVPDYAPPAPPGAAWGASRAPTLLSKVGSTTTLTTGAANVTVTNCVAAVFSWTNPSSVNIRINSALTPMVSFTASGMGITEERAGTFWCRVIDGANASSLSVTVNIRRETLA